MKLTTLLNKQLLSEARKISSVMTFTKLIDTLRSNPGSLIKKELTEMLKSISFTDTQRETVNKMIEDVAKQYKAADKAAAKLLQQYAHDIDYEATLQYEEKLNTIKSHVDTIQRNLKKKNKAPKKDK